MAASKSVRNKVFISYSHKDKKWLEEFQVHLRPVEREGVFDYWDDTQIKSGQEWRKEIQKALDRTRVAVLLISPNFMASDFIAKYELPSILDAAEKEGLLVLSVILSRSRFERTPTLSKFQTVNNPSKPLRARTPTERDEVWDDLTEMIERALDSHREQERMEFTEQIEKAFPPVEQQETSLFYTASALEPEDGAFTDEVYKEYRGPGQSKVYPDYFSLHFDPITICSPKLSGRNTLVNSLLQFYDYFLVEPHVIRIDIPQENAPSDGSEMLECLKAALDVGGGSGALFEKEYTLYDLFDKSRKLLRGEGARNIILIEQADNMDDEALHWLLRNVYYLKQHQDIILEHAVQIIIEGSFVIQTLTAGPDSPFPLTQVYPQEFEKEDQHLFIQERMEKLNLTLFSSAYDAIWKASHGDKYLTQAICQRIVAETKAQQRHHIEGEFVNQCVDAFVSEEYKRDPLLKAALEAFSKLLIEPEYLLQNPLNEAEKIALFWDDLEPQQKAIAYKGGIVRRKGQYQVEFRAPILERVLSSALYRYRDATDILSLYFVHEAVPPDMREEAAALVQRIEEAAYRGTLHILKVGTATKVDQNTLEVVGYTYRRGEHTGTLKRNVNVPLGEELWYVACSWNESPLARKSEIRLFPIDESVSLEASEMPSDASNETTSEDS